MRLFLFGVLLLCFPACQQTVEDGSRSSMESYPVFEPKKILEIQSTGEEFFSHLGYQTSLTANGDILVPDRQRMRIFRINDEGELLSQLTPGRGPGEIGDAYEIEKGADGKFYVYDQDNDKVIILNKNGDFEEEFIPAQFTGGQVERIFMFKEKTVSKMTSFRHLRDPDLYRMIFLYNYDMKEESYSNERIYPGVTDALLYIDGAIRGAKPVPYGNGTLLDFAEARNRLFAFNTSGKVIAELNADLDTVRTLSVDLPLQKISNAEMDSIEAVNTPEQWKTMSEGIPEYKTKAQKMIINGDRIWLKSSFDRVKENWLVLDMNGKVLRRVTLPKGSMVTHITDDHIGLRLDAVTFALYEGINDMELR